MIPGEGWAWRWRREGGTDTCRSAVSTNEFRLEYPCYETGVSRPDPFSTVM